MFNLVYSKGGEPQRFTLEPGDTVIGRLPGCDVVIDHPSVSRRHAKLTVIGGRCKLQDLESRNGTFVDREPVTETELTDGNEVVFGVVPTHIEDRQKTSCRCRRTTRFSRRGRSTKHSANSLDVLRKPPLPNRGSTAGASWR